MDEEDEDWDSDDEEEKKRPLDKQQLEIQRLFASLEAKAKKSMQYLVTEGFLEPTSDPEVYKYTPEGLVLAKRQYKKLQEDGLL
jgi:predicted transcriptional regulator